MLFKSVIVLQQPSLSTAQRNLIFLRYLIEKREMALQRNDVSAHHQMKLCSD